MIECPCCHRNVTALIQLPDMETPSCTWCAPAEVSLYVRGRAHG